MNSLRRMAVVALFALAAADPSVAEFSVSPVRIFMTPRDRAAAITVVNEGDEDVVMQFDLFKWSQTPDGQEDLKPTEDVILSPPIVKLGPRSRQVLRLMRVGPPPAGDELTYRLIVRDVPEARPQGSGVALQFAIAFSIPVFITPPGVKRQLSCMPVRMAPDKVSVNCENTGRAYALVRGLSLLGENGDKLARIESAGYVLPQIKRGFELKAESSIPRGRVRIQAALDDGSTQTFEGNLD